MGDLLIRGGTLVTMGPASTVEGNLYAVDGRIAEVGSSRRSADTVIDASGCMVLPGFVQAHVHLCQTLFRGVADDMNVVDWLRLRIWPLEQAHDSDSVRASAALAVAELLLSGTTSVLTIETTRHTEAAFEAARDLGIRAIIGAALMDRFEPGTEMKGQTTEDAAETLGSLVATWHGAEGGRLHAAACPRGPRNCTPELWSEVVRISREAGVRIHTHAAENRDQAELLAKEPGGRDIYALESYGALGPSLVMAHCVWLDDGERALLRESGANVCHCPSTNMKLASGFAPVPEYLEDGVNVALGADGAPANNNLDMFSEMRMAALIHKPRRGPRAMPAETVLEMATLNGARALGLESEIGSLEPGKRADLITIRTDRIHGAPGLGSPAARLVFSSRGGDVDTVVVDGRVVVEGGQLTSGDVGQIRSDAGREAHRVLARAGIA